MATAADPNAQQLPHSAYEVPEVVKRAAATAAQFDENGVEIEVENG